MNDVIWFCFHVNCIALRAEAGLISNLIITANASVVREWLNACIREAAENNYGFLFCEDGERLYDGINTQGRIITSTMYKNKEALQSECYDICIYGFPVERLQNLKRFNRQDIATLLKILSDKSSTCKLMEKALSWNNYSGTVEPEKIEGLLLNEEFIEILSLLLAKCKETCQ